MIVAIYNHQAGTPFYLWPVVPCGDLQAQEIVWSYLGLAHNVLTAWHIMSLQRPDVIEPHKPRQCHENHADEVGPWFTFAPSASRHRQKPINIFAFQV